MSFRGLQRLAQIRQKLLPFVDTMEDHDILVAIGAANEAGDSVGCKQLELLGFATPSTVQRRLKSLLKKRVIRRSVSRCDGRRVEYWLAAKTLAAYKLYMAELKADD